MTDFPLNTTDPTEAVTPVRAFSDRHARGLRWFLAGPAALVLSILLMASLPLALPAGRGGVNHLVLPVIFFPLIWAVLIILPVASAQLARLARIYLLMLAFCVLAIVINIIF